MQHTLSLIIKPSQLRIGDVVIKYKNPGESSWISADPESKDPIKSFGNNNRLAVTERWTWCIEDGTYREAYEIERKVDLLETSKLEVGDIVIKFMSGSSFTSTRPIERARITRVTDGQYWFTQTDGYKNYWYPDGKRVYAVVRDSHVAVPSVPAEASKAIQDSEAARMRDVLVKDAEKLMQTTDKQGKDVVRRLMTSKESEAWSAALRIKQAEVRQKESNQVLVQRDFEDWD